MGILSQIEITNFECFREQTKFDFDDATFFIGENNSGKSSVFRALCIFFDEMDFEPSFLNKIESRRKQKGSNICEITVVFNLDSLRMTALKKRLLKYNNKSLHLPITVRFTTAGSHYDEEIIVRGRKFKYDELEPDVQKLIESIKINYIHPQQGSTLLEKAQEKLQKRLLDNWGRSTSFSREFNKLEEEWARYRKKANSYLSNLLTDNVKSFWGKGSVMINLPHSIRDIIKVGDVSFQADETLPEISLTSHGTGVQQSLLYYASYVLDSDRTTRRNTEYHPVWLLEEPESFLHADMIIKLAKDLTSEEWLDNIQLCITTHSGLLLASSINPKGKCLWNILSLHKLKSTIKPTEIDEEKVIEVGTFMGDPNFDIYFYSKISKIFIEDKSEVLISKLRDKGMNVKGLGGISEVKRYIQALEVTTSNKIGKLMNAKFVVDGDKGKNEIKDYLKTEYEKEEKEGFKKYILPNNTIIVTLPEGKSSESLFDEFPQFLNEQAHKICDENLTLKAQTPTEFASVVRNLHKRYLTNPLESWEVIEKELAIDDSVKHHFWKEVNSKNYAVSQNKVTIIKELLKK